MTPEALLKKKTKEYLKPLVSSGDLWYFMPVPTGFGMNGVPDFILCYLGQFMTIETKAPTGKLTANQIIANENITKSKGLSTVAHSISDVVNLIEHGICRVWDGEKFVQIKQTN